MSTGPDERESPPRAPSTQPFLRPEGMLPPAPDEEDEPEAVYHSPDYLMVAENMDYTFYLQQFPPKFWIPDPAQHYLHVGWEEGFDPHPDFSTGFYLEHNADIRDNGINPFVHYLKYGRAEGRNAGPWSETEYYDLIAGHMDVAHYLSQLPPTEDVSDPVAHYMTTGWRRGFDPSEDFSTQFYLQRYPDVRRTGRNPFAHYLEWGIEENRITSREQLEGEKLAEATDRDRDDG